MVDVTIAWYVVVLVPALVPMTTAYADDSSAVVDAPFRVRKRPSLPDPAPLQVTVYIPEVLMVKVSPFTES